MNACARNRKRIAMLAIDALNERQTLKLRNHFDECPGCREYWREMAGICAEHSAAARNLPDVAPDNQFHERLVHRIHETEARTAGASAGRILRYWFAGWRVAIPAGAVALLLLVCWPRSSTQTQVSRSSPMVSAAPTVVALRQDPPPTYSAYRTAANHSLEALDDLLTRQGARKPWSAEALKASVIASDSLGD